MREIDVESAILSIFLPSAVRVAPIGSTYWAEAARNEGLLLVPAGDNVIRLLPPLTVSTEDLERAVKLLGRSLERVGRG